MGARRSLTSTQLRADAEAELAGAPLSEAPPRPADELLHELQVLQIELEMQNESLRQAQIALEESRDRYADFYYFAPIGCLTLTADGLIEEINQAGAALLGEDRSKLIHTRFSRFVVSAEQDIWHRHFLHALRHDEKQSCELSLQRKDGMVFDARLDCLPTAAGGTAPTLRISLFDITESKQTMAEQRRLNRALRLLSECNIALVRAADEPTLLSAVCRLVVETGGYLMAWIGFAGHDAEKSVRPVAQSGYEDGYLESIRISWDETREIGRGPTGTAIRTGATQVNHNCLNNPKMAPWREAAIQRGYQSSIALPLNNKQGTRGALTLYAAEPDAFGAEEVALLEELVRNLEFGIQALRTRAKHEAAKAELRDSEERLRLAKKAAALGIYDWDIVSGRIVWDERVRELRGVGPEELITYADIIAGVHPDDRLAVQAAIDRALDPDGRGEYFAEYRIFSRADGKVRHIAAHGQAFFEGGCAVRLVGTVTDITAQKLLDKEIQERRAEMELLANQQVAAHTASAIAHELNQPLVSISAYSEAALRMLSDGTKSPEKLVHALQGAVEQAQRAGRTLHELLAFLHQSETTLEPIILNEAVQEALAIAAESGCGEFHSVVDLARDLPPVQANYLQVKKVLLNLLYNGIEAMRAAGVATAAITITVRTGTFAGGDMAQVTVQDSGPGLDAETAQRIFEPFFTTKPRGMGLGLAISRALIEAHGGQLWLDSESSSGAAFHFTLPFAA